jgi:hypothetical protein
MATAMEKIAGRRRTRDPDRLPRRAATAPEPAMTPVAAVLPTKGRPPGSGEERDRIAAYLTDFARELNDQAPLASSVTRALRAFQQAKAPRERWGDYLYQARSITQEHSAQIKTKAQGSGFGPKPKMAYYFAVLEDLLGLKPDAIARPPTPGQGP